MGKIIGLTGSHGGAGATTSGINLAISLAQQGKKVLFIDTDPMGTMAAACGMSNGTKNGIVQLLRGQSREQVVKKTTLDIPLSLLTSGVLLPSDAFFLERQAKNGRLGNILNRLGREYDYTIVDTPSNIEAIITVVYAYCQAIILVLSCHSNSIKTLPVLLRLMQRVQGNLNPDLHILGILASQVDYQNPYELDALSILRVSFPPGIFFSTIIPRSHQFEKAAASSAPLCLFPGKNKFSRLYSQLTEEFLSRISPATAQGNNHDQPERLF